MLYNLFENRDFVSVFAVALLAEGVDRNDTGKATLENICKEAVDGIILKKWTAKEAADYIGKWAVEMTHDYFNTKLSPPKSATTQLTSTQYQPLFDTGRLYNSISYSVDGI